MDKATLDRSMVIPRRYVLHRGADDLAATEMLGDLEKDTVEYMSNYDDTQTEPVVLPSKFPILFAMDQWESPWYDENSSHNICEIVNGLKELIDNPESEVADLAEHIKAPDFPKQGNLRHERRPAGLSNRSGSSSVRASGG